MSTPQPPNYPLAPAMIGPELIGQPAVAVGRGEDSLRLIEGDIEGICILRGAYPSVTIGGRILNLDDWNVALIVPPRPEKRDPSLAERLASPNMEASTPRATASIRFERRLDETPLEGLRRHVGETGGAISTCWSNLEGAGTFDSTRASELTGELLDAIAETFGIRFP